MIYKDKYYVLQNEEGKFLVESLGEGTFFSDIKDAIRFEDQEELNRFATHNTKFNNLYVKEVIITYEIN